MKTSIMKSVCVAIVMMVSSVITANAQPNFFFDKKYDNGRITSSTKYELGESGLYEQTFKFEYSYNESGITTKKERFKWDSGKKTWISVYLVSTYLNENENTITYELSTWDNKKKAYNPTSEKVIHKLNNAGNIVSIETLKKDKNGNFIPNFSGNMPEAQELLTKN